MNAGRILIFTAHPDDAELCVSGTLTLLRERGWQALVCPITAGGMGGSGEGEEATIARRLVEGKKAASLMGAEFFCLGGRDGFLYDTTELRLAAIELLREFRPGIVIAHLSFDYHPDHRAASSIGETAALLSTLANVPSKATPLEKTPALYHCANLGKGDPLGNPAPAPGFFIDISGLEAKKEQYLACHESQIEVMKKMHGMDDFARAMHEQDSYWGSLAGCQSAEPYWQHLGGGFPHAPLLQEALKDKAIIKS